MISLTEREREILSWIKKNPAITQKEIATRAHISRSSVAVHISNLAKKGVIVGRQYILSASRYVVVVGGANIDLAGYPEGELVMHDSNPGHIKTTAGGAGRNIAENLVQLETDVRLITAFGSDERGAELKSACKAARIEIGDSVTFDDQSTGTYFAILDESGDMQCAVADMAVFDKLLPKTIAQKQSVIENAAAVVLDTNVPEQTIRWVCEHTQAPIFCDPVSTQKAHKVVPYLGYIHTIKPNRIEAEALTGIRIDDRKSLLAASNALLSKGIKQVFISLDKDGLFVANEKKWQIIPLQSIEVKNATGAGDAMMAAIVWAQMQGEDQVTQAYCGLAASRLNIGFEGTVNTDVTPRELWNLALELDMRPKSKRRWAKEGEAPLPNMMY